MFNPINAGKVGLYQSILISVLWKIGCPLHFLIVVQLLAPSSLESREWSELSLIRKQQSEDLYQGHGNYLKEKMVQHILIESDGSNGLGFWALYLFFGENSWLFRTYCSADKISLSVARFWAGQSFHKHFGEKIDQGSKNLVVLHNWENFWRTR